MPIVLHHKQEDGSQVAVWRIDESEARLASMMPHDAELEIQLNRFSCPTRRLEWLASRVLLGQLGHCLPVVEYSKTGQPFIRGSEHCISISHTRGFAAVCLSPGAEAGVDIEYPSDRISRLQSRFVNPAETLFIPEGEQALYHGLIWCAKETLYKVAATPGLIFKESLLIEPFVVGMEGQMLARIILETAVKEYRLLYKVTPEYYLVWLY